jgi:hypothetical protein
MTSDSRGATLAVRLLAESERDACRVGTVARNDPIDMTR